jgi:tetrahydromethanopterin S-methyltransferase subunit H
LFKFKKEQQIFEIGGIKVGGQPGELPTVLIGSIFHEGQKIVKDRNLGLFDKEKAKTLISIQEEMSEKTGIPCMLDVVGQTSKALVRYIDFISNITDIPILVNGPDISTRISGLNHGIEIGLRDKMIYNSINYTLSNEEIQAIKEIEVKSAIIQAFNPSNPLPKGMISIFKGTSEKTSLLEGAIKAGITKPLAFTPVLDVPAIGYGAKGLNMIKEEYGLPTGTAPVGVIGSWKKISKLGKFAKTTCRSSATTLAQTMGADYIIYGSVAKAKGIFPACAMIDAIIAYHARDYRIKPISKKHPLYRVF